jgi:2-polyprenyl-3-methyl-5-hydroxy-6-metoxy-1,4-benzoquinol methylase
MFMELAERVDHGNVAPEGASLYDEKKEWYYAFVRKDIAPLLPRGAGRVLEVGCGGGGTLAWLKESGHAEWTAGIELSPEAAQVARTRVDQVYCGDLNEFLGDFPAGSLDLILCLDVLEHLVDPWAVMARLQALLRPGGKLIASLPNVRHRSVVLPLLLHGKWEYREAGIMDRTHLRFFSRQGIAAMLRQAGLRELRMLPTYSWGSWDKWIDLGTGGLLRGLLAFQYLTLAERPAD